MRADAYKRSCELLAMYCREEASPPRTTDSLMEQNAWDGETVRRAGRTWTVILPDACARPRVAIQWTNGSKATRYY